VRRGDVSHARGLAVPRLWLQNRLLRLVMRLTLVNGERRMPSGDTLKQLNAMTTCEAVLNARQQA
jgi:hypothetical protein